MKSVIKHSAGWGGILAALLLAGCQGSAGGHFGDPARKVAVSGQGMAVAAQPLAAEAARDVLEEGGNAADAAVAAGFVIAVVEQTMNSIGGRSQVLVRVPHDSRGAATRNPAGAFFAYNGMTEVPAGYTRPQNPQRNGYTVIGVPGVVSALGLLHQEHGSLPWPRLLEPAIRHADQGFTLLPGEAARHSRALENIQDDPGFRQNILKADGSTHAAGETLTQPRLAATLRRIAAGGAEAFYEGDIAAAIAEDMKANGGYVTAADLAAYRTLNGRYITMDYRGYRIHTIAAPAGGGLVVKALNIMERFNLSGLSDAAWAAVVNQALALAIETMGVDYQEADLERMMGEEWAEQQAQRITVPAIPQTTAAPHGTSPLTAQAVTGLPPDPHHTTHFVTADCDGMAVSITQTVGPLFGSKVITPGLGFVYASTMGTYLSAADQSPGSRPRTTIAPTIVTRNGEVELALGAAGGLRILSGIVQTLSRYMDRGMTLQQAVAAPRIHPETTTDRATGTRHVKPRHIHAETTRRNGWSDADIAAWQAAGFEVEPNDNYAAFSRVHALARTEAGTWLGAADLDWEGAALAPAHSRCNPPEANP